MHFIYEIVLICVTFIKNFISLKQFIYFLFLFCFGLNCSSQNFHLQLTGSSDLENKVLDSINYISKHNSIKSISEEINTTSEKLYEIGYIENLLLEKYKPNDSSYIAKFSLGEKTKSIHIYIDKKNTSPTEESTEKQIEFNNNLIIELIGLKDVKDTLVLPYIKTKSFLSQTLQKLEQRGYALAKLKLINIHKKKQILYASLQFELDHQRQLNSIVIKYLEDNNKNNFPEGHLAQINRKYLNNIFNKNTVQKIREDFENFRFVSQVKYPEILLTKDTTKIYVYLDKRKSNTFDGFIGFSNNTSNKIKLNGYLDITLENTLNVGEQFSLYWKSDGNNQKTFKTGIEIPYLFKSPIGLKTQLYIFKQDSTYQNTKTAIELGYFTNYNTRLYLGYQSNESSDIQNTNSSVLKDYKNSYITTSLDYFKFDYTNLTFPEKSKLSVTAGIGKRTTNNSSETVDINTQFYIKINAMHNFYLNQKNLLNINFQNYFLKSNTYIINELFRFGGINSIRGFVENSLQANFMTAILTEYRYIASPSLYIHSILDYGHYQDDATNNKKNLIGLGIGIGVLKNNGLIKLAFTNGSFKNQEIKLNNTIIQVNYSVGF